MSTTTTTTNKRYPTVKFVTWRDITTDKHYYVECKDLKESWEISRKLLQLGDHKYTQIRFRKSRPTKTEGYILKIWSGV